MIKFIGKMNSFFSSSETKLLDSSSEVRKCMIIIINHHFLKLFSVLYQGFLQQRKALLTQHTRGNWLNSKQQNIQIYLVVQGGPEHLIVC